MDETMTVRRRQAEALIDEWESLAMQAADCLETEGRADFAAAAADYCEQNRQFFRRAYPSAEETEKPKEESDESRSTLEHAIIY